MELLLQTLLKSRSTTGTDLATNFNYKKKLEKNCYLSVYLYTATARKVFCFKSRSTGEETLTGNHYMGALLSEASKILKTF